MNNTVKKHIKVVDGQIKSLFYELSELDSDSEDYENVLQHIDKLVEIRQDLTENRMETKFGGVDVNTIVNGGISIASILAIMKYEKAEIITTKAWSLATRMLGR